MDEMEECLPQGIRVRDVAKLVGDGLIKLKNGGIDRVQHSLGSIGKSTNGEGSSRDIICCVVECLVHAMERGSDGRIESLGYAGNGTGDFIPKRLKA